MYGRMPPGGWRGGHELFWGPAIFHTVLTLIVLAAIVWLVVWVVTTTRRSHEAAHRALAGAPGPRGDRPLEETRMRYARGEINREEFQRLSEDLGGPPPGPGSP